MTYDSKYKRYYFVDLENVHRHALVGVNQLTKKDCVRIYYSDGNEAFPIDLHLQILNSPAHFEYIKIDIHISNFADCQILSDISTLIQDKKMLKKTEVFIISRDNGYNASIRDFSKKGMTIGKFSTLDKKVIDRERNVYEFVNDAFTNSIEVTGGDKLLADKVVQLILTGKTKTEINAGLMRLFDNSSVKLVYDTLKPIFETLPGQ